jgi:hypothetical protein
MNAISPGQIEIDPLVIDPRECGECGLTIDQHRRVDTPEEPEFLCVDLPLDEMPTPELERRAELIRLVEVAEIMARLEAMDDPSKRLPRRSEPEPYRPAASTIAAFKYVCSLNDADYLARWLANHPADAPELFKIWKGKRC